MRLFIAVPLPATALDEAARVLRTLRESEWPVRWVRDDGLHITLKFFGEVTTDRLDAIEEMMEIAIRGMRPMEMTLQGGGAFPTMGRPRVLRLEVAAGPDLELLQDRLERGGEQIGFAPEGRPFRPHVTLGRVREGHRLPSGAMGSLETMPRPVPFLADRVVLYESRQTPLGPLYRSRLDQQLTG